MKTETKKVVGCIEFISEEEYAKFGFTADIEAFPVLVYSEDEGTSNLFMREHGFSVQEKFKFIPEHLIKKFFTIDEAKEEFPELFL